MSKKDRTYAHSFCPECGSDVRIDEDGCCAACGCGAVGEAVEKLMAELIRLRNLRNYACHTDTCDDWSHQPCNCGYEEAVKP